MKIRNLVLLILLLEIMLINSNCDGALRHFNVCVDLNGDRKPEIVFGEYGEKHKTYWDYNLMAKFSTEGYQAEPRLIQQFRNCPDQINFIDIDGDGSLDLVFNVYGEWHRTYIDYDTYVAKNDGSGNFGSPVLISRQKE